jgi:hypothetical protein
MPQPQSKYLWLDPPTFLRVTNALVVAQGAVQVTSCLFRSLPAPGKRGPKAIYRDELILLMAFIQIAWQLSYEEMIDYVRARPALAALIGCPRNAAGVVRVISVSHYWSRRRGLGIAPFFLFFVGMVWQLVRLGVIRGRDLVLDGSVIAAWWHDDPEAGWSFPKKGKGATWGYKIHTVLDRHAQWPVMFLITAANRQECVGAIPLLIATVACYGFQVWVVRADAGYFTHAILHFIRETLGAGFVINYNLRRRGKRDLATLFFLDQWHFHQRFRSVIERHFAWAKRYFGLNHRFSRGALPMIQHAALVYATMNAVALAAHRYGRPDLALSRKRVLAAKVL